MSTSVLFIKVFKTPMESENTFNERVSLYGKATEMHNLRVWQSLPNNEKMVRSKGKLTEIIQQNQTEQVFTQYNPYVDSGFDIFQPGNSVTQIESYDMGSQYYHPNTSSLLKLGIAAAMYTLNPDKEYYNKINWDLTNERSRSNYINNGAAAAANSNIKPVPYGGVFSQILLGNEKHLMNTIVSDIMQNSPEAGSTTMPITVENARCYATPQPYKLHPRSSIYKKAIRLANSTGIIDSGYRGELCAAIDALPKNPVYADTIQPLTHIMESNKRYFQICKPDLSPFYVCPVTCLPETERGAGGFGSTGR